MNDYLSYFTPGQMTHETLEFILVKRQRLIERLVERVRSSALTGAKHQSVLLGPRGMGKSHVVALVYHRAKALPELADKIVFAWLAEEEWSVASLADLYLVILRALANEYPDSNLQADINALRRLPRAHIADAAAQKIRDFANGRTLLLLVENLEEIFRGLGEQGQWAFRSFLNERPFVTILATTSSLFAGIQKQDQAFYGFFKEVYLDELTADEAAELLGKVAARRGDTRLTEFLKTPLARDRVQAVHDLAGGHPRIYLLFAHLITEETLDELVSPFLKLLDELTPYYQSRMQLLAPQQRKIVESLCDRRGAVTVKTVAEDNLLSPQATASQLGDLERMGYARKTAVGRESFYELREPMLRMVIEVKRGRGEPIRLVVDFLRRWYSRAERRERLSRALSIFAKSYWEASLDLDRATQDTPALERVEQLTSKMREAIDSWNYINAADLAAEVIECKAGSCTTEDWYFHAYLLELSKNLSAAVESYSSILKVNLYDSHAVNRRGLCLYKLHQYDKALKDLEIVLDRGPHPQDALFGKAGVHLARGQSDDFMKVARPYTTLQTVLESEYVPEYIAILLEQHIENKPDQCAVLVKFYEAYHLLMLLGSRLTNSIPALFEPGVTQERAEAWLAAWEAAGGGKPNLTVPLRLLKAAVAWKPKRDVRVLLALAIEERRILEQLLPKDADAAP